MRSPGSELSKQVSDTGRFQANRITLSATTREKVVAAGSWTGFRVVQECKRYPVGQS